MGLSSGGTFVLAERGSGPWLYSNTACKYDCLFIAVAPVAKYLECMLLVISAIHRYLLCIDSRAAKENVKSFVLFPDFQSQ